jgi:hypothetical protein
MKFYDFVVNLPPSIGHLKIILDNRKRGINRKDFQYFIAFSEHDAIHYLCDLGFSKDEELIVARIEDVLECGFGIWRNNTVKESLREVEYKIPDWLTHSIINEVSNKIRKYYYEKA